MGSALAFATQLLTSLPGLISAGSDVIDLIKKGNEKLKQFSDEGRDPTAVEWADLNEAIDAKRRVLHG